VKIRRGPATVSEKSFSYESTVIKMGRMKSLQIHQSGYQPLYHIKPPTVDRRCRKSVSDTHALFAHTFCLL